VNRPSAQTARATPPDCSYMTLPSALTRLAHRLFVAIQLDQNEGVQEDAGVVPPVTDAVEAQLAVLFAAHRLAVDDAGS
jgi:hypothetical protein